jgi:hypothetical protein
MSAEEDGELYADEEAHQLAAAMLEEVRDEIAHADEKASLLIGGLGIALTLLATGFIEGGWQLNLTSVWARLLWIAGGAAALLSVAFASLAVWPRLSKPPRGVVAYWGHLAGMRHQREVAKALVDYGLREPERTYQQLLVLSAVAIRKYRNIRVSMATAGVAGVLIGLALAVTL